VIDHNIVRLNVSVHDALAVAEVEGLKEFENVVSHIVVLEFGVQAPEIGVVDIFEYQ
jgi:hypothetical protein